jgi:transposase-like protein
MSHSPDFKRRVVDAVNSGEASKTKAARLFGVSRSSIDLWLERAKEDSSLQNRSPGRKSVTTRIDILLNHCRTDLNDVYIKEMRKQHPGLSEAEFDELCRDRSAFLLWFHEVVEKASSDELRRTFEGQA